MIRNFRFLNKYIKLQKVVTLDEVICLPFATITYSREEKSAFYNFALVDGIVNNSELNKIEAVFFKKRRTPAIYFENRDSTKKLKDFLSVNVYKQGFEDSWMFHNGQEINHEKFNQVKKVESEKDLKIFLKIFNDSYQKGDPQNPYGEVTNYLEKTKKTWRNNHQSGVVKCFIAYENHGLPVAVAMLTSYSGIGYISNVGSLQKVRGQGFGKLVTLSAVQASVEDGNVYHCLATEEGHYPNEFYKRIGFKTKFTAVSYSKIIG